MDDRQMALLDDDMPAVDDLELPAWFRPSKTKPELIDIEQAEEPQA